MGDAGEGLIDAESRIQERMEEAARERTEREDMTPVDPIASRALESLRLARADLQRQFEGTSNERRRESIQAALGDIDRKLAEMTKGPAGRRAQAKRT
jgi:hypothetical protein